MGGFSGLNALIEKKQGSAPAPVAPTAPAPQAPALPAQASSFGGLNSLIAKKTGAEPVAPDSSNPIVGTAQKAGRGLGSALGTVGNALDLPLAAAENILKSGKAPAGAKIEFEFDATNGRLLKSKGHGLEAARRQ